MVTERLHLRAEDAGDLPALSALVQDMALKAADIGRDAGARRLLLVGNRYRWEHASPTRIRSALRFDHVEQVQRTGWPASPDAVLALLAIVSEADGWLLIRFSGGTALRLQAEVIDISLDDLSGPWGASSQPRHDN